MSRDRHDPHPLAPDDPRISEWLDGRLTAAEAAEIERLVAASPELTRLVADLRGMRGALGAVPVTPPPAGFVRDVLAAIDAAGDEAADEAEIEEEWRRIERQRLAGEIAEAEDDAAEPAAEPMRQRWPWLALVGALAAGVLVAVAINRPGGSGDREVALAAPRSVAEQAAEKQQSAFAEKDKEAVADTVLNEAADGVPAADRAIAVAQAREQADEAAKALTDPAATAGRGESGSRRQLQGARRETLERGPGRAELDASARGLDEQAQAAAKSDGKPGMGGGGGRADSAALAAGAPPKAAAPAAPTAAAGLRNAAVLQNENAVGAKKGVSIRTMTYRIRSAADRQRLDELVAASGGVQKRAPVAPAEALAANVEKGARKRGAAEADAAKPGDASEAASQAAGRPAGTERIVLSGRAAALASLAAALEADADSESLRKPEARLNRALGEATAAPEDSLLVIEIVDESGVADGGGVP